ncbi:class I SAM-dependent methyltransferase [Prauserella muralis]|uniref:Uncharacterized protein n=1 Tax=Prauserella muralis TaxID=588067 RepID=A0A2V4ALC8_9PSEU|nr:class I SAM-dependent methyltransferase [Prauserella muralis]PXY20774.1 hypothetical protein BAY60_24970 [Prauserella muralis]TWE29792.1 methyltransferase family protein [Prauserella muralis]
MTTDETYLLGSDDEELRRLEHQAEILAPATRAVLRMAGIEPGMRVLDLGTGAGDVAFEVASLVGPTGSVIGIDRSADALRWAARRTEARGCTNVSFIHDDLHHVRITEQVDAVVGRLVLLYTPDPAEVLRRFAMLVRPGGVVAALEYEMAAAGSLPATEFGDRIRWWISEAFRRSGLDPILGARLGAVFGAAGLSPTVVGLQSYRAPGDPEGPRMAAGILRTLLPVIERTGIATADEIGIDTLEQRLAQHLSEQGLIFKPPTLVGAWSRTAPLPGAV